MPKYYVSGPNINLVLSADSPLDACIKASEKHKMVSVGLFWKVSERGFGGHPEDEIIDDHEIVKEINRRKRKK